MIKPFIYFILSAFFAFAIFVAGANKLFPLSQTIHDYLVEIGQVFPQYFPFLGLDADILRLLVGVVEVFVAFIFLGAGLGLVGNCMNALATLAIIAVLSCATYVHVVTKTDFIPAAAMLAIVFVRHLFRPSCKC